MSYRLYVFGSNGEGQLGITAQEIVSTPVLVPNPPPLDNIKCFRSGDNHTLLLDNSGTLYGAGDNRKGQLDQNIHTPTRLEHFERLRENISLCAATCESSTYMLFSEPDRHVGRCGSIQTLGTGLWGELGRGDSLDSTSAIKGQYPQIWEAMPGTVTSIVAGVWHYIALLSDGSLYGWGKARLGQLGGNLSGKVSTPTKIAGIPFHPAKVVCGKDFTYLASDPSTGQHMILGKDKFNIIFDMPSDVKGWKDIGATWHAIFVLFEDGKLIAWGKENMWKLIPQDLSPIDKIAVGSDHILAITNKGKLISWGWGKHGNCGDLSKLDREVRNDMVSEFWNEIDIPGEISRIAAGFCTSFVVTKVTEHGTQ